LKSLIVPKIGSAASDTAARKARIVIIRLIIKILVTCSRLALTAIPRIIKISAQGIVATKHIHATTRNKLLRNPRGFSGAENPYARYFSYVLEKFWNSGEESLDVVF